MLKIEIQQKSLDDKAAKVREKIERYYFEEDESRRMRNLEKFASTEFQKLPV